MKQILLGKQHDVTDFASKDKSRYVIQSVHYNRANKCIEAVDGRVMVRVPVVEYEGDFPPVKGQLDEEPVDCIIPCPQFKKALANIPKSNVPALEHAKLDANGQITLTTTDLDTQQSVTVKPIEGTYPNLDAVMPTTEAVLQIAIAGNILKRISEYAMKNACDDHCAVLMSFVGSTSPMRFSISIDTLSGKQKVTGCAMPVKIG